MRSSVLVLVAGTVCLPACGDDSEQHAGGAGGGSAEGGAGGVNEGGAPAASNDWCERALPGQASAEAREVGWSAAHANIRFFGTEPDRAVVDDALATALSRPDPFSSESLSSYAASLGIACALPAAESELGPASVELDGETAIVRPGTGEVSLPASATRVVIDLRGVPESPALPAALENAVGLALASPLDRHRFLFRQHSGMTDEVLPTLLGVENIYSNDVVEATPEPLLGGASEELPLVVLTEGRMAPSAAAVAIELRLANRAWIAGEDLLAAVAESKWVPVGDDGILFRDREVRAWPDAVAADLRTDDPLSAAADLFARGEPTPVEAGGDGRTPMVPLTEEVEVEPDEHDLGHGRAALVIGHGAARLFFPYFDVVGDTIDEGLLDALGVLETSEGQGASFEREALGRFSTHLHDSHGYVFYFGAQQAEGGVVPVLLDETSGHEIVVRTSGLAALLPGDVVLEVDGVAIDDLVAEGSQITSASNEGALLRNALELVTQVSGDTLWRVRGSEGAERDVDVPLAQAQGAAPALSSRTEGFLDDLGAPGLYYINLDSFAYDGSPSASELMATASTATGLILDGRGYPGTLETWNIVRRILSQSTSVKLRVPHVATLGATLVPQDQQWNPVGVGTEGHFDGPVVVIVGPSTQSQAEHILMPLVSTGRVTFIGRRSAGANGTITGVMVPGATGLTFTGTETRFDDGSMFHGIGIEPSVIVYPDPATLAAGGDPELEAAIGVLEGG